MNTPIKPYKPSDWVIEPGTPEHDAYMAAKAGADAAKPAFVPKTVAQVKDEFDRKGISISAWARQNGVRAAVVTDLLSGRQLGRYGQAHKVAVLLGLKEGEVTEQRQAT